MFKLIAYGILLLALLAPGNALATPMKVFVSILPQKYFVEQIGGDRVDVAVMVRPGDSPAVYEPKPAQMVALTEARIYFAIDVPFERVWLKKIATANPKMRIAHTAQGIQKRRMESHHHAAEPASSREGDNHRTGILDPHVWLSPPLVRILAKNILHALLEADPGHSQIYHDRFNRFIKEIDEIHAELQAVFKDAQGMRFMVFHPAWGYFAETYGLEQVPVEIEGKAPKPGQLRELIDFAKDHGIKVIFVQPQFSIKHAKLIAREISGRVVLADPLAENWSENLRQQAKVFKAALK